MHGISVVAQPILVVALIVNKLCLPVYVHSLNVALIIVSVVQKGISALNLHGQSVFVNDIRSIRLTVRSALRYRGGFKVIRVFAVSKFTSVRILNFTHNVRAVQIAVFRAHFARLVPVCNDLAVIRAVAFGIELRRTVQSVPLNSFNNVPVFVVNALFYSFAVSFLFSDNPTFNLNQIAVRTVAVFNMTLVVRIFIAVFRIRLVCRNGYFFHKPVIVIIDIVRNIFGNGFVRKGLPVFFFGNYFIELVVNARNIRIFYSRSRHFLRYGNLLRFGVFIINIFVHRNKSRAVRNFTLSQSAARIKFILFLRSVLKS